VLLTRTSRLITTCLASLALATTIGAQELGARTGDNVIQIEGGPEGLPFSPAVRAGGMIYLSGQIGNLPGTLELPEGVEAQARQAMENIRTVLEAARASLYDVVKCTVFLDNTEDYWAFNQVYAQYWDGAPPARSAFAASGLALGALPEIECLARDPAAN
jgi:2-iminobutanoate/2-iminopropanoate deaminase